MDQAQVSQPCALCGAMRKLEQSHIVPQFVYRWAQPMSGMHDFPNAQPRAMLCGNCEDRFSVFESEFARRVFHPFTAKSILSAKYLAWLRKFAASVCWRIIEEGVATNTLGDGSARWTPELSSCRETWRHYLMGQRPDVGAHHLHLLPWPGSDLKEGRVGPALDAVLRLPKSIPAKAADPTLHPIERQIFFSDLGSFVYAKLGPLVLLGLITDFSPQHWRGTRLNAEGKLKPRDVSVPDYCRDFLDARVRHNSR